MKTKKDPRFDARIAEAAVFARPILRHLRKLVHAACPEAEETIKWGHLAFAQRGNLLCLIGAFKAHCTFGFWHQDMKKILARDLGRTGSAMGLLGRITCLADLPDDEAMQRYLRHAAELNAAGAPSRPKSKPKPPMPVPTELAAALRKNKAAATTWEKLSPSARRDYLEWITEAKREETREKRLVTTMEWLAEGKKRNWKYEDC